MDRTVCPVCGNMLGFANGVCVRCGYDHITHEYFEIKVRLDILKTYLPHDVLVNVIDRHENYYLRMK